MKARKVTNKVKQSIRKLKYLDKTQLHYFVVMSFLIGFCLFTGTTYSYFTFSKHLNAATITIAKLSYTLSSTSNDFNNGTISIAPNSTLMIDLDLESLNKIETKYALKYITVNDAVKVYYSESVGNNMSGVIGPRGSEIAMRIVIKNDSEETANVEITVSGGYLQNTLTTNITEGYYEDDIILKAVLFEKDLTNGLIEKNFPAKDSGYAYIGAKCNNDVTTTWDNENWQLTIDDISARTSCEAYFKKLTDDIEVIFVLKKKNGDVEFASSVPNDGTYSHVDSTCNTDATATWNTEEWKMEISDISSKTLCTGNFTEN